MDYDDIAAHFLVPTGTEPPSPDVTDTPARRLRDSVEAIATIGWWSRAATDASRALGHDFFDGYVWGRAAALGADVDPAVVTSAFGVFSPDLLGAVYAHGRSISRRDQILEARERGAIAGLRAVTADVPDAQIVAAGDLLLSGVQAVEPGPRALFAALQSLPVPDDPHGRLWRGAELIREHRGDSHLAAFACTGLDRAEMNVLTETWLGYAIGEYSASRGLGPDVLGAAAERLRARGWLDGDVLTPAGLSARLAIEADTDAGQQPLIDAFGGRLERATELAGQISDSVLAANAAPADPRKRAAG
jgi:hypothetical protein